LPRKKRMTKSQRKKRIHRILLIVGLIIAIPVLVYGTRIYNLYNTIHEPLDEEEFEAFDPEESSGDNEYDEKGEDEFQEDFDDNPIPDDTIEAYQYMDDLLYDAERSDPNPDHLNILLMGIDTNIIRGGGISDSIMVVRYNKKTEEAAILSIPRDTYVRIPGRGYDKINHASAFGGTSLLKETVEGYLDIHIDHYVRIDMKSFEISVNSLGGLMIDVPERMVHRNGTVFFEAGRQHMDGSAVLKYTRARNLIEGEGSDFGRIKRQQQVVIGMLNKIRTDLSMNQTLSLLEDLSSYLRTDMGPRVITSHWNAFNRLDMNEVEMRTLSGEHMTHKSIYYHRISVEDARKIMSRMAN